eukprot:TRINITY_DN4253_c0_g1_i6.p1 TRINITY_DN4253_c0_g1~~TRINITY_DN4253_c0_g1_i6.p1  ORF type:complete len:545 (+),score=88.12 TRINITY_DN4253_c0_g1_i6:32-1666(+)
MCDYASDDEQRSTTFALDLGSADAGYDTEEEWAPNPYQSDADTHYMELMRRSSASHASDEQQAMSFFESPREPVTQNQTASAPSFPRRFRSYLGSAHTPNVAFEGMNVSMDDLKPNVKASAHEALMSFNANFCNSNNVNQYVVFQSSGNSAQGAVPNSSEMLWINDLSRHGKVQEPRASDVQGTSQNPATWNGGSPKKHIKEVLLRYFAGSSDVVLEDHIKEWNPDVVRVVTHGLMQNFARNGDVSKTGRCAELVLSFGTSPTLEFTLNVMLSACTKASSVSAARYWWDRFVSMGLKPTLIAYNTMINVCGKSKDVLQAEAWMVRMLEENIKPCLASCITLISACGQAGYVSKAEHWYEHMRAYGLRADVTLHNAMIDTYVKSKDVKSAERWFYKMQEDGVMPCQRTYNMMIHVCAKTGNMERAQSWYLQMQKSNFACDLYTYGSLIEGCTMRCNKDTVENILCNMFEEGLTPNIVCLRSLLKVYVPSQDYARLADTLMWCMQDGGVPRHLVQEALSANAACSKSRVLHQLLGESSRTSDACLH